MPGKRRLLLPIGMVLGFLFCAYAAFFVGVRQDFPMPSGAEQKPLGISQQSAIIAQWPQTQNWQTATANLYVVREKPGAASTFYTKAFHNLGWTDAANPGQPKDANPGQPFTNLSFVRNKQQLIVALGNSANVAGVSGDFGRVIKPLYGGTDNLAILVSGTLR